MPTIEINGIKNYKLDGSTLKVDLAYDQIQPLIEQLQQTKRINNSSKHIIITSEGVNISQYKTFDIPSFDKFHEWFAQMNANFIVQYKEYGLAIERLEIKTACNKPKAGYDKFTTEAPIEDKANLWNDKYQWYKVTFTDGSSSGWLCKGVYTSGRVAVKEIGCLLHNLAKLSGFNNILVARKQHQKMQ
ncbi:MAG: hypothetical protein FWE50_01715 [Alphaproteobacteria bacterium]|nr:hypothetical protein [Alphaproteobacteria bacterium]